MAWRHDTMMNPPIEGLLERAGSKFRLVTLGSTRARQINSYFGQLGEGLGVVVPPQVNSVARKPLSIAFEEIAADKIIPVDLPVEGADEAAGEGGDTPLRAVTDPADAVAADVPDPIAEGEPGAE
ncbi:hypothetical protein BH20ACT2_BH20ACT2_12700 [soil metagenome]